ncbi:MAG: hypothetical protein N3A38_03615 [Planctomycetota bacterium]|nr:hypothetical protein [Planctomycetota bacterium]
MTEEFSCAACGCRVPSDDVSSSRAHRIQGRVYCAECSALLVEPQDQRTEDGNAAAGTINEAETQPSVSVVGSAGSDGIETTEEWEIHIDGDANRGGEMGGDAKATAPAPPRRQKRFSRGRSVGGRPDGSRSVKPAGSAGRSSAADRRAGSPAGIKPSSPAVKPSRMERPADKPADRGAGGAGTGGGAEGTEGGDQDREILYRSGKAPGAVGQGDKKDAPKGGSVRASGRKASPSSRRTGGTAGSSDSSRSMPSAAVSRDRKGSSRLMTAAPRPSERKVSSRMAAGAAAESGGRASERCGRSGSALESRAFIYACAVGGILLLILVLALAFSGDAIRSVKRGRGRSEETGLPVATLVQRAEQCKREGRTIEAADYYRQAAEAAQKAGDSETASAYLREAYTLQKFTPVNLKKY